MQGIPKGVTPEDCFDIPDKTAKSCQVPFNTSYYNQGKEFLRTKSYTTPITRAP